MSYSRRDDTEPELLLPLPSREDGRSGSLNEWLERETLKQVMESYLRYYAQGEGHTARAKRYDLQHFLEFLSSKYGPIAEIPVGAWTMQATKDFVDYRLSLGEAPATVARRLATVKHLGRTLAERIRGFINPAREVKSPVLQLTRPSGLSENEVLLLLEAADLHVSEKNGSFAAVRNRFLLSLLLATGLRADEVRLLVVSQISDDKNWLKNVKTKGRKFRNVYLDTRIRTSLEQYLDFREQELREKFPGFFQLTPSEQTRFPLFLSGYHASLLDPPSFGLSPKTVWRVISDFGKKAQQLATEPVSNLHPHKLRHTFAHGLLDTSKDVRLVAQALGHSDVRTTMRYTERTDQEVARAIEKKISEGR